MEPVHPHNSRRTSTFPLVVLSLLLILRGLTASAGQEPAAAQRAPEEVKAEETFTRNCIKCHTGDRVNGARRTRSQWEEVMTTMQTARGAIIADDDWDVILTYLVKHHGRVSINRATVDDLVEVLGLSPAAAENVVKYRREHGNFEDFDALMKVPGLDAEKLDKLRDAMSF